MTTLFVDQAYGRSSHARNEVPSREDYNSRARKERKVDPTESKSY